MARVIVSAGHTQAEPGAIFEDLREVDLTRKIATKVASKLRSKGIITLSVPPELDLLKRIDWINKTGYKEESDDVCIEMHINDGGKTGIEGWYKDKGKNKSYDLTKSIVKEACRTTGLTNQGIKSEYDHPLKTLAFLHNTVATASLIECLYIDNTEDQKFLRDDAKLDLLADGVVRGLLKFFGIDDPQDKGTKARGTYPDTPRISPTMPSSVSSYTPPPPIRSQPGSFPSYPMRSPYGQSPTYGAQSLTPPVQNREDRKKMIREKYHLVLGRKVSDQDLNYFLNLGLSEEQMLKRIIESQEHADLVRESQKHKKIKPEYERLKVEGQELKVQLRDKEDLIVQQNELIAQKNKTIQGLQQKETLPTQLSEVEQKETQQRPSYDTRVGYQEIIQPKVSFFDKILRKLNDIFD